MKSVTVVAVGVLLASCQGGGSDGPRVLLETDGVSFVAPDGFSGARDRGAWILSGTDGNARSTIAIRTAKNSDWRSDTEAGRPPDVVVSATQTVLAALPQAELGPTRERKHPRYRAVELTARFVPTSRPGQRYVRDQVVLFGPQRVMHVVLTHPESSDPESVRDSFERVVESLREEG